MRKMVLAGAVVLSAMATPAMAQTAINYEPGGSFTALNPYNPNGVNIQNFDGLPTGNNYGPNGKLDVFTTSQSGIAARPAYNNNGAVVNQGFTGPGGASTDIGTGKFGAVLGGNSWTFVLPTGLFAGQDYSQGAQVFSFVLGSIDTYNSIRLNFKGGGFQDLLGCQIINLGQTCSPSGNQALGVTNGRVTFDRGGNAGIISIVFSSSSNSMEFDDFRIAAPEPAAWGMMLIGFGFVGGALRMRRRSVRFATA